MRRASRALASIAGSPRTAASANVVSFSPWAMPPSPALAPSEMPLMSASAPLYWMLSLNPPWELHIRVIYISMLVSPVLLFGWLQYLKLLLASD